MSKGLARLVEHGTSVFGHQVLGQIGHYTILRSRNRAACRFAHACYNLQQRALASSILAHKCYTVLLVYLEGNVFE